MFPTWMGEIAVSGSGAECGQCIHEGGSVNVGDTVEVAIRGKKKTADVVEIPFYRRWKST